MTSQELDDHQEPPHATQGIIKADRDYALFCLLSRQGTTVVANISTGQVVNMAGYPAGWTPVIAIRVDSKPGHLVLVADLPHEVGLKFGTLELNPQLILVTTLNVKSNSYALQDVCTGKYLTALPANEGGDEVDFRAAVIGVRQEFLLEPAERLSISAGLIDKIVLLVQIIKKQPLEFAEVLDLLHNHNNSPSALWLSAIAITLLTPEQEDLLVKPFVNDAQNLRIFTRDFADDYDVKNILPRLIKWLNERENRASIPTIAFLGKDRDHLATDHQRNTLGQRVIRSLRSSVTPRRGPAVLATARNEGPFLLEWIAYCRNLGFEEIFLTTNQNEDQSDRLLDLLAEHGVIRLTRSDVGRNTNPQVKAYNYHLRAVPEILDHNWIFATDLDEFLAINPDRYAHLNDYLASFEERNAHSIGVNWRMFGSNQNWRWNQELQMKRFPFPLEPHDQHVKSIYRPRHFIRAHAHYPIASPGYTLNFVYADGEPFEAYQGSGGAKAKTPRTDPAMINHYFFRSAEEFLRKFAKNRNSQPISHGISAAALPPDILQSFLNQFFSTPSKFSNPILVHEAGTRAEMAKIRALPGIYEAEQESVAKFHETLPQIIDVFAESPQFKNAGELGERLIEGLRAERKRGLA